MGRHYSFKIVTYNSLDRVLSFVLTTSKYAFILHDKDNTDPHYHILATFKQNKSFNSVRSLIGGEQNTFVQPMTDRYNDFLYLTHSNSPDKFQYSSEDISCNDLKYFSFSDTTISNEEFLTDISPTSMLSYKELAIKYGRDYIKNYSAYHSFAIMADKQSRYIDRGYPSKLSLIDYSVFLVELRESLYQWAKEFLPSDFHRLYYESFTFFRITP